MAGEKILLVEDDKNIVKLLRYNLEKAGFQCLSAITGEDALTLMQTQPVDAVILDIMLPKMDGLEVCRQLKQNKQLAHIPVIILTAKAEEVDRVVGFELGADDYVVKPFSPRELVLRVRAVLKRKIPAARINEELLGFGELIVDPQRHKVTLKGRDIGLTLMEFKLLRVFIQRKGRVQPREKLLEDVWELGADVTTRTIDTHVKRLRRKLGKMGKFIETVRGIGYRFSEDEPAG